MPMFLLLKWLQIWIWGILHLCNLHFHLTWYLTCYVVLIVFLSLKTCVIFALFNDIWDITYDSHESGPYSSILFSMYRTHDSDYFILCSWASLYERHISCGCGLMIWINILKVGWIGIRCGHDVALLRATVCTRVPSPIHLLYVHIFPRRDKTSCIEKCQALNIYFTAA